MNRRAFFATFAGAAGTAGAVGLQTAAPAPALEELQRAHPLWVMQVVPAPCQHHWEKMPNLYAQQCSACSYVLSEEARILQIRFAARDWADDLIAKQRQVNALLRSAERP